MKRLIILFLAIVLCGSALAYDFKVPVKGYTLYFTIIDEDEKAVEITSPMPDGNYRWMGYTVPGGILDIPAEVEYEGVRYTVVSVGERAFSGVVEITGLIIPNTVTDIGPYAFSYCTSLSGTVTIGEEVISIGRSAFYGCGSITALAFNAVNCESMGGTRSGTVFGNCRSLSKITFGSHVKRIPDYAFAGMDALKFEWNMPHDLEYIGEYAFAYCNSIYGTLRLPDGVKKVGAYAFAQCHSMRQLEIPARIQNIDQRAFYQCVNLAQIKVFAMVPPKIGADAFLGIGGAILNVPCISVDRYRQASEWNRIYNIKAMEPCTLDIYVSVSNPEAGFIIGDGNYRVGDTATLVAVCRAGYGFKGWSDGNTDNPRRVRVEDTVSYVAVMQESEVIHEVEYVHDTTYMDGIEVVYEYYEVNDVAEPIASQDEVIYNSDKRRLDVPVDKKDLVGVALYNDAGVCVLTGKPRHGHINMRRFPSGYYVVRVSTVDNEQILRFFHNKNKQ